MLHRVRLQLAVAFGVFCVGLAVARSRRRRLRAPQAASPAAPQSPQPAATTTQQPAAPATDPARAADGTRLRGAAVLVQNLKSKPEFNGREGRVLEYDATRGRYSVRLLQSGTMGPENLAIKPENLASAPPKNAPLSAAELCHLTLSKHTAVTTTQMEGAIQLLSASSSPGGQQLTEADLSLLLRVVCCFGWQVASHRDRATGEETPALLPHPEHGSGLVLCTAAERLERIGQVTGAPTPAGSDKCAQLVHGAALFL